jgi:hypothetical protein
MLKRIAIIVLLVTSAAEAKQRKPPACANPTSDCDAPRKDVTKPPKAPPVKTITIGDPLALGGTLHGMTLLYFIERANEELERSTLPTKSFVPRLVQSVEEEAL